VPTVYLLEEDALERVSIFSRRRRWDGDAVFLHWPRGVTFSVPSASRARCVYRLNRNLQKIFALSAPGALRTLFFRKDYVESATMVKGGH
jgi:hypothetical protein